MITQIKKTELPTGLIWSNLLNSVMHVNREHINRDNFRVGFLLEINSSYFPEVSEEYHGFWLANGTWSDTWGDELTEDVFFRVEKTIQTTETTVWRKIGEVAPVVDETKSYQIFWRRLRLGDDTYPFWEGLVNGVMVAGITQDPSKQEQSYSVDPAALVGEGETHDVLEELQNIVQMQFYGFCEYIAPIFRR